MALELGLGLPLLVGLYACWVALLGVPLLPGTVVSVHGANGLGVSNPGGGWESPALWAVLLVVGAVALKPPR